MKILIVNAGSSSLKYQLVDMLNEATLAQGLIERIGIEGSKLTQKVNGEKNIVKSPLSNHREAVELMISALTSDAYGVVKSMDEISAVGHRVVQGGEHFTASAVINDEVMAAIEATEEAIINSLFMAETMKGKNGNTATALPVEKIIPLFKKLK